MSFDSNLIHYDLDVGLYRTSPPPPNPPTQENLDEQNNEVWRYDCIDDYIDSVRLGFPGFFVFKRDLFFFFAGHPLFFWQAAV